ncbi:MAG: hypothetical protein QG602_3400 [Verrucomicrobiota bacterium]|nr:hypothetical protein [Verrucomicrobiota bacterium]
MFLSGLLNLSAQVTVYTWSGLAQDEYLYTAGNGVNNTAPANVSSVDTTGITNALTNTQLVFGTTGITYANYYTLYVNRLTISGNVMGYQLEGAYETTHVGSGEVVYAPANPVTSSLDGGLQLEANQTWDVQSGTLFIADDFSDTTSNYTITKTGAGSLLFDNSNQDWSGGRVLSGGRTVAYAEFDSSLFEPVVSEVLGTGTLTFNGGTLVAATQAGSGYALMLGGLTLAGLRWRRRPNRA